MNEFTIHPSELAKIMFFFDTEKIFLEKVTKKIKKA